jgi:excisionase family DNA binding protein
MTTTLAAPARATDAERDVLRIINDSLTAREHPVLLISGDREVELPHAVLRVLSEAVDVLLEGGAVAVLPYHTELTTQAAADYLGVSRPYLIKLLERGELPYRKLNSHRRIMLQDVEEYRHRRDAARRSALAELTRESFELGLYREPVDSDHAER